MCKRMRDFARQHEITNYFEVGRMGIEHALLPDSGLVAPGEIIIGADSHTCTYGALNALSTGMGQTDIGAAMASGTTWFKVPATIKVELTGKLPKYVKGKDIILTLIGMIGVDGARYQSLEFCGDGVAELEMSDRFTICNMAIEAGGKNGIFPVDEKTIAYLNGRVSRQWTAVTADADAVYDRVITIKLDDLVPVVSYPHLPENTHPAFESGHIKIDQVVVGSCTNGRLEDLQQAAEVMQGRKVHPHVRAIIIPATQEIYKEAMRWAILIPLSMPVRQFLPLPADRVWVVIWVFWLLANVLFRLPTVISADVWVMSTARSIWPAPMWRLPVRSQAISQAQRR